MNEIRFRAWDGERLRKVNTIGWVDEGVDFVTTSRYSGPAEDFRLMQYTGLVDKNGVEIFEGDIVKFGGNKYAITFTEGGFGVERIYQTGEKTIKVHEPLWNLIIDGCEVIGNIYEHNPELWG